MTATKEKPILFSASTIQALLSNQPAQTRRPVTHRNSTVLGHPAKWFWPGLKFDHAVALEKTSILVIFCGDAAPRDPHLSVPFQHPEDPIEGDVSKLPWFRVRPAWGEGDRFWVKETWTKREDINPETERSRAVHYLKYRADGNDLDMEWHAYDRWLSPVLMPRWASRLTVEVAAVRPERDSGGGWAWVTEYKRVEQEVNP